MLRSSVRLVHRQEVRHVYARGWSVGKVATLGFAALSRLWDVDDEECNPAKGTRRRLLCFTAHIHVLVKHRVALAKLSSISFHGRKRKG